MSPHSLAAWRITLVFGRVKLKTLKPARSETEALIAAQRYAAALGYSGHPDHTYSRRI